MKTAAKVFIIIGMVTGFWTIVPIIVGAIALNKLASATKKDELVGIGVCTLLFCSMIGGIFMLVISDAELQGSEVNANTNSGASVNSSASASTTTAEPAAPAKQNSDDVAAKLTKLKELRDSGAITEEEFASMKNQLISKM